MDRKNVFVIGLVTIMLIAMIGMAVARPTAHLGGDINDGVTLQGRNLPEATLGIGPQPETTLGIGPQEENVIGGEVVTEKELAEKIAAIAEIELPRAEHDVPLSYGEHEIDPNFSYGEHDIVLPPSWEREE